MNSTRMSTQTFEPYKTYAASEGTPMWRCKQVSWSSLCLHEYCKPDAETLKAMGISEVEDPVGDAMRRECAD